jgi:hypothetical protein
MVRGELEISNLYTKKINMKWQMKRTGRGGRERGGEVFFERERRINPKR